MTERSPKFPFISLAEAIDALRKIDSAFASGLRPNRATLLGALDYSSEHGAAMKMVAALIGYGLLGRRAPENPGLEVTDLGRQVLDTGDEAARLTHLRRAALAPPMFRRIWRRARMLSPEELADWLLLKGFTEGGARRAAAIYIANNDFARLGELQIEPDLPEDRPRRAGKVTAEPQGRAMRERVEAAMARQSLPPLPPQSPMLSLPLSVGKASVPIGITEPEFDLLIQTLTLWKTRLVK